GRDGNADRGIAAFGGGPVERGADVVDLAHPARDILSRSLRLSGSGRGFQQVPEERRVAPCDLLRFTAFSELLQCIGPYRFQQSPARVMAGPVEGDERLVDEACDTVEDGEGRTAGLARDGGGCLEREASGEDSQPAQQTALRLRQKLIAQVERRAERLVPRQRRSVAGGQKSETIVQARCDFLDAEGGGPGGGELDGE